jgi:hypothetical protein
MHSPQLPVDPTDPAALDAWLKAVTALEPLDCLKMWVASYTAPAWWIGMTLANPDGTPRRMWTACARFNLN